MSQSSVLGNLLNSVFKRKTEQPDFTAGDVVRTLRLDFPSVALPTPSIHWKHTLTLQQLANLPSNALSGPVQEDKAAAYRFLSRIVSIEQRELRSFDLRDLYGLNHDQEQLLAQDTWEAMAQTEQCRHVRIISIRDFNRALSTAIGKNQTVELFNTAWAAKQIYWAHPHNACELVSALVYARRRELPLHLPARLHTYQVSTEAVAELQKNYHSLVMPKAAWTDPNFMDYLVNHKVPYVRLSMPLGKQALQTIVLARNTPHANVFGNGLLKAGAQEISSLLLTLGQPAKQS